MRRAPLAPIAFSLLAAACGSTSPAPHIVAVDPAPAAPGQPDRGPALPAGAVRAPHARTDQDTNPANLASADVTYAFGKLPEYIDGGGFRLLPYDMFRAATPGVTVRETRRLTLPRTSLVLDAMVVSATSRAQVVEASRAYAVQVSLDGRWVQAPRSHWIFYRNDGPQICRIYFPDDLSSQQMGVSSFVLRPLSAGTHRLHVEVEQTLYANQPAAHFTTEYLLHVLPRGIGPREQAIAPPEDRLLPGNRHTPLAFSGSEPLRR
jgi:hypothetical protein